MVAKEELVATFPNMDNQQFKKKIYETCMLYTMENYKILNENFGTNKFTDGTFYTLEEISRGTKPSSKPKPPKKRRTPIIRTDKPSQEDAPHEESDSAEKKKDSKDGTKKPKSYPIAFNKNAKCWLDFIISRFLWEIYSIDTEDEWPEVKKDLEDFILDHANINFPQCNITQLIIHSVRKLKPGKRLINSHELDRELRSKFDCHLNNANLCDIVATYTMDFLKLLCIFFSQ